MPVFETLWCWFLTFLLFRLAAGYALQSMFEPFSCAVCQVQLKAGQGISVHSNPLQHEKLQGWQGPFLCQSCNEKKDAIEGKRPPRGIANSLCYFLGSPNNILCLQLKLSYVIFRLLICSSMLFCLFRFLIYTLQ